MFLVLAGCEPGEESADANGSTPASQGADDRGHGHHHGHGHFHLFGHHHGHDHAVNDPDVLDIVILTPAAADEVAGAALRGVEEAGGHVTVEGGLDTAGDYADAVGRSVRFGDVLVIAPGPSLSDDAELLDAVRHAGLRGVRVVVVGEAPGEPGLDYMVQVRASADAVTRGTLLDAAIAAAVRLTGAEAAAVPAVIEVDGLPVLSVDVAD